MSLVSGDTPTRRSAPTEGNLGAVLEAMSTEMGWGARTAYVVGERTLCFDEVHDGAARSASLLAMLGVRQGDTVLLVVADGVEFVWSFLGVVRLGAVAVAANPRLTADDYRHLVEDCAPVLVVCDADLVSRFDGGATVLTAEALAGALASTDRRPAVAVAADAAAYATCTSGTTGTPRAAVHRHRDPLVFSRAFGDGAIALRPSDIVVSVSKMYFAYGLGNSLLFPLLAGACAVLHPGPPRAADIAALVERHQATVLFAVPTFYAKMLRECQPASFASLRVAVSAGETLSVGLAQRAAEFLGCPVLDGLGSTEVGQTFASNTLQSARPGTVGRALPPYSLSVRDSSGRELPADAVGMLWVRGPTLLTEYLGSRSAKAACFDGEWMRTGDLACIDGDGFVHHRGRADDMEMVGGMTVAPQEIEELLSSHAAVAEVAVAAVRDRSGASKLRAFVVPAPGAAPPESVGPDLVGLVRSRLAPYKVPRSVTFVDALPRTATGKLCRFVLRSGSSPSEA